MAIEITDSVRRTADKYIKRTGKPIIKDKPRNIPPASWETLPMHVLKLSSFILWHKNNDLFGGYRANEAFDAFCKIIGTDGEAIKKVIGSTEW